MRVRVRVDGLKCSDVVNFNLQSHVCISYPSKVSNIRCLASILLSSSFGTSNFQESIPLFSLVNFSGSYVAHMNVVIWPNEINCFYSVLSALLRSVV